MIRVFVLQLISAVVMKDWKDILKTCDLQNWKEALAAVMTYAQPEEFSTLCGWFACTHDTWGSCFFGSGFHPFVLSVLDLLGGRLEAADEAQLQAQACLCYICAGNVEKLVCCWTKAQDGHCPLSLQVCSDSDSSCVFVSLQDLLLYFTFLQKHNHHIVIRRLSIRTL